MSPPKNPECVTALLRWGTEQLRSAGSPQPSLDARVLLLEAGGLTAADLLRDPDQGLPAAQNEHFKHWIGQRARGVPLAYVLGKKEFWSLDFEVTPATLIPRPDSEALIEAALRHAPQARRVVDLGTGSGCLLLAALSELPNASGLGIDRSLEALQVAARNAARLGLRDRCGFVQGDWAAALADQSADLVLCNPPYIGETERPSLQAEVLDHEPHTALFAGPDGLEAYRRILGELARVLSPLGIAVMELGHTQADAVQALAQVTGRLETLALERDLAGHIRALVLKTG